MKTILVCFCLLLVQLSQGADNQKRIQGKWKLVPKSEENVVSAVWYFKDDEELVIQTKGENVIPERSTVKGVYEFENDKSLRITLRFGQIVKSYVVEVAFEKRKMIWTQPGGKTSAFIRDSDISLP